MFVTFIAAVQDFAEAVSNKYRNLMMKLTLQITGNIEDAEDAFQDALFSIDQNRHKIENLETDRARNYIYTVTRNAAIRQRKNAALQRQHVTNLPEEVFNNIEGEADIDAFHDEYGFSEEITAALKSLNQEDKDLICYYYGAQYSYREISKVMDVDAAVLRKRMQRCKKKLAEILANREGN